MLVKGFNEIAQDYLSKFFEHIIELRKIKENSLRTEVYKENIRKITYCENGIFMRGQAQSLLTSWLISSR